MDISKNSIRNHPKCFLKKIIKIKIKIKKKKKKKKKKNPPSDKTKERKKKKKKKEKRKSQRYKGIVKRKKKKNSFYFLTNFLSPFLFQQNSKKCHFLSYFFLPIFHSSYYHLNQTYSLIPIKKEKS